MDTAAPLVPDFLRPDWPAPSCVRAVCTSRSGGCSQPPFASFNLGDHVDDSPVAVARNRAALARALGVRPVFLRQVHGSQTVQVDEGTADGATADAALSTSRMVACAVMVADCLPVLLTNRQGSAVGAVHAGWRGLLGVDGVGVLESASKAFLAFAHAGKGQEATEMIAWLGPCIGPQAFEVGAEVRGAFVAQNPATGAMFAPSPSGRWRADLQALARQRLQALGVQAIFGNDGTPPWCTVSNPSRFFSYRRDGRTGRIAACIWRV